MHSGSSLTPNNPAFSISVGIASLVLEGRPLCDDEYATAAVIDAKPSTVGKYTRTFENSFSAFASTSQNYGSCSSTADRTFDHTLHGRTLYDNEQNDQLQLQLQHQPQSTNFMQLPLRPLPAVICDEAVQHIQRLRHKLLLIRSSPSTSRDIAEQSIAVTSGSQQKPLNGYESDDELDLIFKPQHLREGNLLNSLQSLATSTCLKTTPRSFNRTHGLLKTVEAWTVSGYVADQERQKLQGPFVASTYRSVPAKDDSSGAGNSSSSINKKTDKKTTKQFGPHCEQFMKKIGLIKVAGVAQASTASNINIPGKVSNEIPDFDVHYCCDTNENVKFLS